MTENTADKRAYERFDLQVPARMGIIESGQGVKEEVSLETINICAGGAFLLTDNPLPEGTRVKMDFILSIDKLKDLMDAHCRIKVEGEVIRREKSGMAVRFEDKYEMIPEKRTFH